MDQLFNSLLTLALLYGYPIIFVVVALAYIGLPIPLNAFLLVMGALTSNNTFNIYILVPTVAIMAILGDTFGYYLGKRFGSHIVNRYTKKLGLTELRLEAVDGILAKYGSLYIFITRWLITPLGIPVNIMAGIREHSFKSFLFWCALGEFIWSLIYIWLGHFFGANWSVVADYIEGISRFMTFAVIGFGSFYVSFQFFRKRIK